MGLTQRQTLSVLLATAVLFGVFWVGMRWYRARRERDQEIQARSYARELGVAAQQYEQDHNHLPDAGKWEGELAPYLGPDAGHILHPPTPPYGRPRCFALYRAVSGRKVGSILQSDTTPLFYESVALTPSASDNMDTFPNADRDGGHRFAVVFVTSWVDSYPTEWAAWAKAHPDKAGEWGYPVPIGVSRPWQKP